MSFHDGDDDDDNKYNFGFDFQPKNPKTTEN